MRSDASLENTPTLSSGLNWYATIGADEVSLYALLSMPLKSSDWSGKPSCCGNRVFTWPGWTVSMLVCPVALVSVNITAVGCGFDTTMANGECWASSTHTARCWQVEPAGARVQSL